MSTFLHLFAKDLVKKYNGHFDKLTIIFPNKRAGLFLAEELSKLIYQPVWMPEIFTLSEFIERRTGLKKAEDLTLIIKLYKSYLKVSGIPEKFEDFYYWGNMLLGDFDDIDKYMADAKALFSNLTALKELEQNFPYLTPEQVEAIKSFWKTFNPEKYSQEQQVFLNVWDKLYDTYTDFKSNLVGEDLCYEGMGQRRFCEYLETYDHPEKIIFAGFNALNICEKKIFSFYQNSRRASFYWDYDTYYISNKDHEAGHYIRENLVAFPNELGPEHFNNFRHNGKQIEYISVPSGVGQAKLIPTLTEELIRQENHDTAIVLCDERMLAPVIHSIPSHVRKINITMGYPAQNTPVAALISMLGDLKSYAKKEKGGTYYYYKPVIALLNHKLIKEHCPDDISRISGYINQKNIIYIAEKHLHFNEITRAIFSSGEEEFPIFLLNILERFIRSFNPDDELRHPIEKEMIFSIYTQIQILYNIFKEEGIVPENKFYVQIINRIINTISIPFSGEPLEGLQLMGLMETRMLDFKNLIILSANEGILPKSSITSSFIPYNLRSGFALPVPEHQDALFAYYFYRLLQRAKSVKILYSATTKGINSGEMSRFLYQIKYESGLPIRERNFQNLISIQDNKSIRIAKNDEILQILDTWCESQQQTLSPSALNIYLECPLKFYFRYIARIEEKEEISEELDHRLLGTIFHECAQSLYTTVPDGQVTENTIDQIIRDDTSIDKHIRNSYLKLYNLQVSQLMDSGSNELILDVIKKYIREMLKYDKKNTPFRIIAMEQKFSVPVEINTDRGRKQVFVGGYIDRIDRTENGIRIIDYKTGSDTASFKDISSLFDRENGLRNKAAFQTMLYCLMYYYSAGQPDTPLIPGIYSIKLLSDKEYNHLLKCNKEFVLAFDRYKEEFHSNLIKLLEELYSTDCNFEQAMDGKKCRTCCYAEICRR